MFVFNIFYYYHYLLIVWFSALRNHFDFLQAIIVHRSLCILHAVLNHLSGLESKVERRYKLYLSFSLCSL